MQKNGEIHICMLYENIIRMLNALNFAYANVQGGGESFTQVFERCKSALLRIGRKHKGFATIRNCLETSLFMYFFPRNKEGASTLC